jgi:hypothetical protein
MLWDHDRSRTRTGSRAFHKRLPVSDKGSTTEAAPGCSPSSCFVGWVDSLFFVLAQSRHNPCPHARKRVAKAMDLSPSQLRALAARQASLRNRLYTIQLEHRRPSGACDPRPMPDGFATGEAHLRLRCWGLWLAQRFEQDRLHSRWRLPFDAECSGQNCGNLAARADRSTRPARRGSASEVLRGD